MIRAALAALALALVPATCQAPLRSAHAEEKWQLHRTCSVINTKGDDGGILELDDVLQLQKFIPALKKCSAFWQCVADREAGKVKHCYENDRRWR
jgi:hypothetical protein